MQEGPPFPGQVDLAIIDLDQMRAFASPARSEVFWAFDADVPRSAADVAADLGKSPQSIHYHIQELLKVGLLMVVATRQRRSRTEHLLVHAMRDFHDLGRGAPKEYREYGRLGFAALARAMIRENENLHKALDLGVMPTGYSVFDRRNLKLSFEDAGRLKKAIQDLIDGAKPSTAEDAVRVTVIGYMCPSTAETRRWIKGAKGKGRATSSNPKPSENT